LATAPEQTQNQLGRSTTRKIVIPSEAEDLLSLASTTLATRSHICHDTSRTNSSQKQKTHDSKIVGIRNSELNPENYRLEPSCPQTQQQAMSEELRANV
jgi:hypothetical protein